MNWLLFTLISIAFTVTYSLVSKKILNQKENFDPISYAFVLFITVSTYSLLFYLTTSFHFDDFLALFNPRFLLLFAPVCVLYAAAPSLYYRALKNLPISEVTILYSFTGIYALIIGIVAHTEHFSFTHIGGGLCILISTLLITMKTRKLKTGTYFYMMLGATCMYALAAIIDNQIVSNTLTNPVLYQALNFGIPAGILLILNPKNTKDIRVIVHNHTVFRNTIVNGLFFFGSFYFIFRAYSAGGSTSQVNIVLSTETIVTVLFATFLLNERHNLAKTILAAGIATVGILLITL